MKNRKLPGQAQRAVVSVLLGLILAGCGGSHEKGATQAAAKVNSGEITVHQINQVLQQQPGLRPEQADGASREVLERLIDQELAIQQAEDKKIDREPAVVAAIEAAKRDIIARAYADRVAGTVAKPAADEAQAYYNAKPALFSARRIYNLAEFNIEAGADRKAEVEARLKAAKTPAELADWLTAQQLRFTTNRGTQPAESLPLALVDQLAALPDGQGLLLPVPGGLKALVVESSKQAPVKFEQARPAIEQFLGNDRKRAALDAERKALRAKAKIEYLGKFAEAAGAASAPAGTQPAAQAAPALAPAPAASGTLDDSALKKGLGLK